MPLKVNPVTGELDLVDTTGGGGGGGASDFVTDSGTATESGSSINIIGGTAIDTSGAGATVTIDFDVSELDTIPTSVVTDSGTVTPVANSFSVLGSGSVSTSGSGSVLTITAGAAAALVVNADTGTGGPVANILNILGDGNGIDTSISGNSLTVAFDVTETADIPTSFPTDSGTATPAANAVTIAGTSPISTSASGSTVTIGITDPLPVVNGGTGVATLTDGGIILGSGTSDVTVTAQPTNGQLLIGSTGVDPVLSTLTAGTAMDITNGAGSITLAVDTTGLANVATTYATDSGNATPATNILNVVGSGIISTSGATDTVTVAITDPVPVVNGGTGVASLTDGGIILGSGTGDVTVTSQPTNGQVLIGSTGVDPVLATLTAGTGISVVEGAGSITIASTTGGLGWTVVTDATQALAINNGYIGNRATSITFTLPVTASVGDIIRVTNIGAGLPIIAQNASQLIHVVGSTTTTGATGSLTATEQYDSLELVCVVANTTFNVLGMTGNWTIA